MKLKKALCAAVVMALWGAFVSVTMADEDSIRTQDFIKERTYVGILGTSTNIDTNGDFNGSEIWQFQGGGTELNLVPSIDRSFGWGFLAGHREGVYAAEISYWRTNHGATWGPNVNFPAQATGTALFEILNIDFKRYLLTQLPTQPFFGLGVNIPSLVVHQGSTDSVNYSDLSISGVGFNLSAGLEIYLGSNFSILGGAEQRWTGYSQFNGIQRQPANPKASNGTIINLEGDGLNFFVGGTVGFE